MLAIAALLRLEAARIDEAGKGRPAASVKRPGNALAKIVREKVESIVLAKAAIVSRSRN